MRVCINALFVLFFLSSSLLHHTLTFNLKYYFFNFVFSDARNMAKDVHNIVLKVVQEKGNMSETEAITYVKKMESQKRYSADVWS